MNTNTKRDLPKGGIHEHIVTRLSKEFHGTLDGFQLFCKYEKEVMSPLGQSSVNATTSARWKAMREVEKNVFRLAAGETAKTGIKEYIVISDDEDDKENKPNHNGKTQTVQAPLKTQTENQEKKKVETAARDVKLDKERADKIDLEKQNQEIDRLEKEAEKRQAIARDKWAKVKESMEAERLQKEKAQQLELERLAREHLEATNRRQEQQNILRMAKELIEKRIEKERIEKERIEKERIEKERREKELQEKEQKEKERKEKERKEKERKEKERKEKELENDRLEKERQAKQKVENERLAAEKQFEIIRQEERKAKEKREEQQAKAQVAGERETRATGKQDHPTNEPDKATTQKESKEPIEAKTKAEVDKDSNKRKGDWGESEERESEQGKLQELCTQLHKKLRLMEQEKAERQKELERYQREHTTKLEAAVQAELSKKDAERKAAEQQMKSKTTFVVCDTNIVLHHLHELRDIMKCFTSFARLVVPLAVLRELDYQKNVPHLSSLSREGSRYIEEQLDLKRAIIQSNNQYFPDIKRSCNDDDIFSCSVYYDRRIACESGKQKVILCTNDRNLRLKARSEMVGVSVIGDLRKTLAQNLPTNTYESANTLRTSQEVQASHNPNPIFNFNSPQPINVSDANVAFTTTQQHAQSLAFNAPAHTFNVPAFLPGIYAYQNYAPSPYNTPSIYSFPNFNPTNSSNYNNNSNANYNSNYSNNNANYNNSSYGNNNTNHSNNNSNYNHSNYNNNPDYNNNSNYSSNYDYNNSYNNTSRSNNSNYNSSNYTSSKSSNYNSSHSRSNKGKKNFSNNYQKNTNYYNNNNFHGWACPPSSVQALLGYPSNVCAY